MLRLFLPASLLLLIMAAVGQNPPTAAPRPAPPAAAKTDSESDELAGMKADLQRMRATVYQMQTNLAFVGNTTTPLYHEFELDIQMWQTMLEQMQRRVDRLEKSNQRAAEKQ